MNPIEPIYRITNLPMRQKHRTVINTPKSPTEFAQILAKELQKQERIEQRDRNGNTTSCLKIG